MLAQLDDQVAACAAAVQAHSNDTLRQLLLFGSRARSEQSAQSDVDLLVLIEPLSAAWGPADNIAERRRLHALARPHCTVPIDLWVRTVDQYEESRSVIGGVEYLAATRGISVYSRPSTRAAVVRHGPDEIRYRNVRDVLEDARRLLGRAVLGELQGHHQDGGRHRSPEHYAWRAIQHAVRSVFVWRQVETPEKTDDLATILAKLRDADTHGEAQLTKLRHATVPSAAVARDVLREVTKHLSVDPPLASSMSHLQQWLAQPLYRLANTPALKN